MTEKKWTPITTDEASGTLYVVVSDSPTPPGAEIDDGSIAGALARRKAFIAAGAQVIRIDPDRNDTIAEPGDIE